MNDSHNHDHNNHSDKHNSPQNEPHKDFHKHNDGTEHAHKHDEHHHLDHKHREIEDYHKLNHGHAHAKTTESAIETGCPLTEQDQAWAHDIVVYQIYPRSFKDSNNDGVGDLQGIIDKLDYLNNGTPESLGVNAIWLSPIYKSPMADFGYDVSDYRDIDPLFGDLDTFKKLVEKAHKRNIKIIMDFVPNHTSNQHAWFLESKSSKDNPKRDWYVWKDPKVDPETGEKSPPNNWLSIFGGSAWEYDETTGQYYEHTFLKEQPDLNWRNPEVREAMMETLEFWLHLGVDGFRNDAVYYMFKDPEFRDDPINPNYKPGQDDPYDQLIHKYSEGYPEILETTSSMCELVAQHDHTNAFFISEVYIDLPEMAKFYRACSNTQHAPFNFKLIGLPWNAQEFKKAIDDFENNLTDKDWPNFVLGNHDQPRIASRYGRDHAKLLALMLLTLRGMPFIYSGEEIGMENTEVPLEKQQDPFGKQVNGSSRDPQRTPFQWNNMENAGFTNEGVEPWLPINENFKTVNVEYQKQHQDSFFNLYRRLIWYRKDSTALKSGEYHSLELEDNQIFAYLRDRTNENLLVILNFSENSEKEINLEPELIDHEINFKKGKILASTSMMDIEDEVDITKINLKPLEGKVIKLI